MSERQPPGGGGNSNPGWYRDPWGRSAWRWWDGWQWSGYIAPAETVGPAIIRQLIPDPTPATTAPAEAPYRERLPGGAPSGIAPLTEGAAAAPLPRPPVLPAGTLIPPRPPTAPVAEAAAAVPPSQRRRLLFELLIVMAVFPLPYSLSAIEVLTKYLLGDGSGTRDPNLFPGHVGAALPFLVLEIATQFAGAALALYLLSQPGRDGGPMAIGLDRRQIKADLSLILPVWGCCFLVPQIGLALLFRDAFHLKGISPANGGFPTYYVLVGLAAALAAGVVEEIVVLGYLVRRLEQLGLRPVWVVLIAVAVRGSYHLYYGWGVLPILGWALASVLLYRWVRRLTPFIIVHICWDGGLTIYQYFGLKWLIAQGVLMLGATIIFTSLWISRVPRRQVRLPT